MAEPVGIKPRKAVPAKKTDNTVSETENPAANVEKGTRRKISGNLPYTSSPGVLRRVLEKIPVSEKPAIFNTDFLGTVMSATGGAARPIPPILKAAGFLNQTGAPTELYSQFQTSGGRSAAAFQALKTAFSEIFKRNTYAHKADKQAITDIIVSITGLPKSEKIVGYIYSTFQIFQDYAKNYSADESTAGEVDERPESPVEQSNNQSLGSPGVPIQLAYNINIVLPETTNIEVFNAIFKSLKGNLLN